ncbi:hypothetical protein Trydic_g4466 [Trypoxylus dichotomus]
MEFATWIIYNRYLQISYEVLKRFFLGFCAEMSAMEHMFIKMTHIYSFICQLFFMTLCEVAIIRSKLPQTYNKKDEKLITGLTTLLFYSVFGYFVNRLKEIYLNDWSRPRRTNNVYRDYSHWLFKVAIEWAKAIIVVICLKEQGMNYHPNAFYNIVTFAYYLCTEKIFCEIIEAATTSLNLDTLDALEYLYVPLILRTYTALSSTILILSLLRTQYARYALVSSYFLLYLNMKDLCSNYVYPLVLEKQTFASFRVASVKDIEDWDDICAVCLTTMSKARITPCNHLFHPYCLKRCLKNSFQCPLCKQTFIR